MSLSRNLLSTIVASVFASAAFAGIAGQDNRVYLSERETKNIQISKEEAARLMATTGVVICPTFRVNGTFVNDNHTLVSSAHRFEEELDHCYFRNYSSPKKKIRFQVSQEMHFRAASKIALCHGESDEDSIPCDQTSIVLPSAVKDAVPFSLYSGGLKLEGMKYISIDGAPGDRKGDRKFLKEPLIQECTISKVHNASDGSPLWFESQDCDSWEGSSGGADLIRVNGELHVLSVHSGSVQSPDDPQPITANAIVSSRSLQNLNANSGQLCSEVKAAYAQSTKMKAFVEEMKLDFFIERYNRNIENLTKLEKYYECPKFN